MKKAILITIGIAFPLFLAYFGWKGYHAIFQPGVNSAKAPYNLFITPGTTTEEVYAQFQSDSLLLHPEGFMLIAKRKGLGKLRPGHYVITEEMSSNAIVNMFKAGLQTPVKVQFNAAESLEDLAGQLAVQLMADSASLLEALDRPMVGWEGELKMGAYLPDTYEFYWNADPETVADRLYQNTISFWSPERVEKAKNLGLSPGEVSTLASIVMKESSKGDDRPLVARLYLNRLQKGMKLQADPTVIYAMKRINPDTTIRRVLRRDLKIDDPYNTYQVEGLPPGPICVPEQAALRAVLNAPQHNYLFMCADPDRPGYHAFASNYAQHLVNQSNWTSWLNNQRIYR